MRRPGAFETREAVLNEDSFRRQQEQEQQPTQEERDAARMLFDGLGPRNVGVGTPVLKDLHNAFTKARTGAVHTERAIDRLNTGMNKSRNRFIMDRGDRDDDQEKPSSNSR